MTMQMVCDGCGELIDTTLPDTPWWVVTVQQASAMGSTPLPPGEVAMPTQLQYHLDHLPIEQAVTDG